MQTFGMNPKSKDRPLLTKKIAVTYSSNYTCIQDGLIKIP